MTDTALLVQLGVKQNNFIDDDFKVVLCYSRAAGMIVQYEFDTSVTRKLEAAKKDGLLLVAYFVPSMSFMVSQTMNLDEYLRKSELADHNSWSDISIDSSAYCAI